MTPRWSIVIPTYRRPQILAVCLQSLAELDYPRDAYEVIVINDGGEPLDSVAAGFAGAMSLRVLHQANAGPGAARNRGASEGRGELLAFTDDDCTPEPGWLANLESQLVAAPDCLAGGRVVNILSGFRNVCSASSQSLVSYLYTYYNRDPQHARFFTSNNMALDRRSFLAFGGFDVAYHRAAAEDREFCDRWIAAGRRLVYQPKAVVRHAHKLSLYAYARQHFTYGRGALHFRQSRAARHAEAVRLEPMDFYTRLLTYPWREREPHVLTAMSLLFLSQAFNAAGFFFEKYFGPPLPPALQPGARGPMATEGAHGVNVRRGSVRHDAFLLLAGGMVVRLCGLLFVVVLARTLSERQIGIFSFAEAVADVLILIASFNLDSLIVRRIASGPPSEVTRRFAPLLGFRLVSAPVYLLVICTVALLTHSELRWVLPVVGVCTLMESLYLCISDMFVGISEPAMRARIEVTSELIFSVAFVLAMWARPTLASLVAVSLVRGLLLLGLVLYLARARFGRLHVSWDNTLIVAGIPFLLMTFLSLLQGKLETVLLGVLSNYETVGVFQLALRLMMAAQFIPQAAASALYPRLAGGGWTGENRRRLLRGLGLLAVLGVLGCGFLLIFGGPVSRLIYGAAARQVAPVLKSMAPLLPIRFAALFMASVLTAVGRERLVLGGMIAGTVVGLTADVLLIPRLGAIGASIALFTTALCQCAVFGLILWREIFDSTPAESVVANVDAATAATIVELPNLTGGHR